MEFTIENNENNGESLDKVYGLIVVPWGNKAEWFEVYQKAYSDNLNNQIEAYNMMQLWQNSSRNCPLGVICTSAMLQGIIKDASFHPAAEHILDDKELKFLYGGALTRFLNFLGTTKLTSATQIDSKKVVESFYSKAKKLGVPDWIVNVRHQIAHGTDLPEIGLLRLCIMYVMKYLKITYWEIENKKMEDGGTLNRLTIDTLNERLLKLLSIYIKIKEHHNKALQLSMAETELREQVLKVNENRLMYDNAQCKLNYLKISKYHNKVEKNLMKYSLDKCWKIVIKYVLEYKDINDMNIWQIITSRMVEDSITHKCVRLDIWGSLIKAISDLGRINCLLEPFMNLIFKDTNSNEITMWAKKWSIIILQALVKRSNVEKLKLAIIGKKKHELGWWERRVILSMKKLQRDHLKQLVARTKHDPSKRVALIALAALILIVEKRSPFLRSSLRFTCNPLSLNTIKDYIQLVCSQPNNDFTEIALDFFVNMLPHPNIKMKKPLKSLLNVYVGKNLSSVKRDEEFYTLPMALKQLRHDEATTDIEQCLEKLAISGTFIEKSRENYLLTPEIVTVNPKPILVKANFEADNNPDWSKVLQVPWGKSEFKKKIILQETLKYT